MPEPEYSVQGYASATMAYAAAHKVPVSVSSPMNLNAGDAKVPLLRNIAGIWHVKPVTVNLQ